MKIFIFVRTKLQANLYQAIEIKVLDGISVWILFHWIASLKIIFISNWNVIYVPQEFIEGPFEQKNKQAIKQTNKNRDKQQFLNM